VARSSTPKNNSEPFTQHRGQKFRIEAFQSPAFMLPDRLFGAHSSVLQKSHPLYSTTYKIDFAQIRAFCTRFWVNQVYPNAHADHEKRAQKKLAFSTVRQPAI
jgi:hypothetical protein